MTKLIKILDNDFLDKCIDLKLDFSGGAYNKVLIENGDLKFKVIKLIYKICMEEQKKIPYVISGFTLKPYLNLVDNLYDVLNIDLGIESKSNDTFKWYCELFNFENYNLEFSSLSNFEKLISMFIVSLYYKNDVILFDSIYSFDITEYMEFILKVIKEHNLYKEKVFIEIKKQVND